jgi:hypothetical protein
MGNLEAPRVASAIIVKVNPQFDESIALGNWIGTQTSNSQNGTFSLNGVLARLISFPLGSDRISVGDFVSFPTLFESLQHQDYAGEGEHRANSADDVSPVRKARCFFSGVSGAPLSAQISSIVVGTFVAGFAIAVGVGLVGNRRSYSLVGIGCAILFGLIWWSSPC